MYLQRLYRPAKFSSPRVSHRCNGAGIVAWSLNARLDSHPKLMLLVLGDRRTLGYGGAVDGDTDAGCTAKIVL